MKGGEARKRGQVGVRNRGEGVVMEAISQRERYRCGKEEAIFKVPAGRS